MRLPIIVLGVSLGALAIGPVQAEFPGVYFPPGFSQANEQALLDLQEAETLAAAEESKEASKTTLASTDATATKKTATKTAAKTVATKSKTSAKKTATKRLAAKTSKTTLAAKGKINVNTASFDDLLKIRGLTKSQAEEIISFRQSHGRFQHVEDLTKVQNIEPRFLRLIKKQLTTG